MKRTAFTADSSAPDRSRRAGFAVVLGYFAVYLGYGLALPVLPGFLREVLGLPQDALAHHTGLLTAAYPLALAVAAPLWGLIAARRLGRGLYAPAAIGYALSVLAFGLSGGLAGAYAARISAGIFAGGVSIAALNWAGEADAEGRQARRFVLLALAATAGLLAGPALGGWLAALPMAMPREHMLAGGPLSWPFLVGAGLAAGAAVAGLGIRSPRLRTGVGASQGLPRFTPPAVAVLALSLLATATVGGFEVRLALRTADEGLDPALLGLLFGLCGLTMGVVQGVLYLAGPPQRGRRWMRWAFIAGAAGLVLVALPTAKPVLLAGSTLLTGLGIGFAVPLLPYYVTLAAGGASAPLQGLQVSLANLGQALGAALVGWLVPLGAPAIWAFAVLVMLAAAFAASALPLAALTAPASSQAEKREETSRPKFD